MEKLAWNGIEQAALPQVGEAIAKYLAEVPCVILKGEMGAGKTTLASMICKALGVKESVSSPTYSLVNSYNGRKPDGTMCIVHHMDLYRIENEAELLDAGIVELFYDDAILLIEWPQIASNYLPEPYLVLDIYVTELQVRNIELYLNETQHV
jgi:tRNA threonylcarbamoyladenosine biosynthesis protein TsaE